VWPGRSRGDDVQRGVAPRSDQAFLGHNHYAFTDIITLDDDDPTTNEFVWVEGNGNFREQKATLLDPAKPNVYQFTAVEAGTFWVYDAAGELLLSGSGNRKLTVISAGGRARPSPTRHSR